MTQILDTSDPESYVFEQGKLEWEMTSLEKNYTWDLVPRPPRKNIVKCRWVYQTKFTFEGAIEHHKSHLVAKLFS